MVGTDYFRTFRGLSDLKLYDNSTDIIYNLPVPLDISIDNGIQERRIPSRNLFGEQIFSEAFPVARDPVLRIVFPTMPQEILQFKTERKFSAKTLTYQVAKTVEVAYMADDGTNLTQDLSTQLPATVDSVEASITVAGQSDSITATYTAGVLSVVKADVANADYISLLFTCTGSVTSLGDRLTQNYKLFASMVNTDNELVILTAPKVKPSFQGSAFSPTMEQIECIFYMYTPSSSCKPYDIIYTNKEVVC